MWRSIKKGPYVRLMIPDLDNTTVQIIKPLSKMIKIHKKQYIADVRVMNYLLQSMPNDIYNLVDACKTTKEMWQQIKRLMYGSDVTNHVRHSRLMDEFDKFAAIEGESLEFVYERLTTLVNIIDRNNVRHNPVSINTKFLNCLQPEWSKYVTMRAIRNHDPLAQIAHSNASSSQSHASSSYSHSPQPYYVTHPSLVVDYEEDYQGELQGDSQEDKLTTAMIWVGLSKSQASQESHCNTTKNDGEMLHSTNLKIDSPDSEETLEDAIESRLKMRNKMIQLDYGKLNPSVEQTYFSIPSTSNVSSKSNDAMLDLQILKMPKESKLLKMFENIDLAILELWNRIDVTLLEYKQRRWMSDSQNSLREFYKTDVIPIQSNKGQHQREVNDLIESISQKTYHYADVRFKSPDLLMVIFELKDKHKTNEKRKGVNTKFDKSVTSEKLLSITPFPNHIVAQAKKVSNQEDKTDRSKPVTSHSTPKNEKNQKKNANVIARGMYKIPTQESHMQVSKSNMNVSNSTRVGSSNSVRRPKSKDTRSKNRVLKNTKDKSSSTHVRKVSSSVRINSNKRETMNSTVCQSNASVLNTKTANAVNDGLNIVCISCGKDVFILSQEKYVARYALSIDSRVKRALFTTPVASKSKNLGATSIVMKSRFSVAKTPTATNKVIQIVLWIVDSGCLKHMTSNLQLLRYFVEKFMGTVRFGNDHFATITGYGDYVQGNLMICHVYYGDDLLIGSRESNLYTISNSELAASSSIQQILKAQILKIRTDNGTEFKNEKLRSFYANLGIVHNTSIARTPQQNGVVKRRNRPGLNCSNFQDSSEEINEILSQQDLDNLFGPLYEEYYAPRTFEVSNNSAAKTLDDEDTLSPSLITVEDSDAPNTIMHSFESPDVEAAESSLNIQDPLNMHEFHQQHYFTDRWTKIHLIDQVKGYPGKFVRFAKLMKDNFEMSMMGEMKFFLGLQVHQSPRGIFINQSQYTLELLRKHGMDKCDTVMTPMATAKIDADL
ncbi:retrovirus-related pol polyprotein from transposon TNT 1-94 [Tanacetum coccineum]|uniref:Retrovirus-related pol polyprotein from transposon TNT 1-94 n=1 Tax=Tanacetum coccineum TaxID=301880 RepID=A0ABQ4YEU5_9ASTR